MSNKLSSDAKRGKILDRYIKGLCHGNHMRKDCKRKSSAETAWPPNLCLINLIQEISFYEQSLISVQLLQHALSHLSVDIRP